MLPFFLIVGVMAFCALLFWYFNSIPKFAGWMKSNPKKAQRILTWLVVASALSRLGVLVTNPQQPTHRELKIVRQVQPVYPPLARQSRIQGTVRLAAQIGTDGRVENLKLVSGHPLLVPAAMAAVSQWVYAAPLLNGRHTKVQTTVEINFRLESAASPPVR